jgi:hypothetical protein
MARWRTEYLPIRSPKDSRVAPDGRKATEAIMSNPMLLPLTEPASVQNVLDAMQRIEHLGRPILRCCTD